MLKITKEIKSIEKVFLNYFKKHSFNFNTEYSRSLTINILGLLDVFTNSYENKSLEEYNHKYKNIEKIRYKEEELFNNILIVLDIYEEEIDFDNYTYLLNEKEILKLSKKILKYSNEKIEKEYIEKLSIVITIYYIFNSEYTKNTVKIFEIFENNKNIEEDLINEIKLTFNKECEIFYGKPITGNVLENILYNLTDKDWLDIINNDNDNDNDINNINNINYSNLKNNLIFKVIDIKKFENFIDHIETKYTKNKNISKNLSLFIIKFFNLIVIER